MNGANPLRGEADVRIGDVDLVIAVEFARLARLSEVTGCKDVRELYRRLLGFEPAMVAAAVKVLAVHPDGAARAEELAIAAIGKLSAADEAAWCKAAEDALAGHIDGGRTLRGEKTLAEMVIEAERAASGNAQSPS